MSRGAAAPRRVVLLGATGSIGRQACDVIRRYPDHFRLVGVVGGSDAAALSAVIDEFRVQRSALAAAPAGSRLPEGCGGGLEAACEVAAMDSDVVCVAITGAAALRPTLAAIDAGRVVATATKEVLVMAGDLVRRRATAAGARLVPIDSEHSALWQCLRGEDVATVKRLVLTASGGPFRNRAPETLSVVTPAEALRHPTWVMGPKVTIDSATMMNKGLEILEAHFLFGVDYARIEVAIHPDSVVHSYVEFWDGAIVAQLGAPDMRVPIALALSDGARLPGVGNTLELRGSRPIEVLPVNLERFPAVAVARRAGERGGVAPAALNAANEVAVAAFLAGTCRFDEIVPTVASAMDAAPDVPRPSLDDILDADSSAREHARVRLTSGAPLA